MNFSSNIEYAKKAMTKVLNHRIQKLSTMLDANETQLNVTNRNGISIERENTKNDASDNSSIIKITQLLMSKSKKFKVNASIRKHQCETCKKTFISPSQLTIHNRIHSKQKLFACDQCPKAFSIKCNLERHKRLHTGEKPFHCDICLKKFTQSNDLTRHKMLHTGEKPFSCDLCPKKFTRSYQLKNHKRHHT
jgi:uncharacterized Zn-finger protein